jgi:hypothetical protein
MVLLVSICDYRLCRDPEQIMREGIQFGAVLKPMYLGHFRVLSPVMTT